MYSQFKILGLGDIEGTVLAELPSGETALIHDIDGMFFELPLSMLVGCEGFAEAIPGGWQVRTVRYNEPCGC